MSGLFGGDVSGVSRLKPLTGRRSSEISALDIGSSKIACLIARLRPAEGTVLGNRTHAIEVIGYGCTRSRGIKSGFVVDLDEAERAIRLAVDAAERMAEMTVGSLIVSSTCGRPSSEAFTAQVDMGHRAVTRSDIHKVLGAGGFESTRDGKVVIHALPTGYRLDGQSGIADPEGMIGSELGLDLHVVSADDAPLRNLELAVNRCHLELETIVAAPYASALSTMVDDEADLGVACIDIGGGTTSLAVFQGGTFVHGDVAPVGGNHITLDIAHGLSTGLADAELLKVRHGSALATAS
ncbi:MAG: cell division protein FtsA, partial [Alphaproteobacteria bacterium]